LDEHCNGTDFSTTRLHKNSITIATRHSLGCLDMRRASTVLAAAGVSAFSLVRRQASKECASGPKQFVSQFGHVSVATLASNFEDSVCRFSVCFWQHRLLSFALCSSWILWTSLVGSTLLCHLPVVTPAVLHNSHLICCLVPSIFVLEGRCFTTMTLLATSVLRSLYLRAQADGQMAELSVFTLVRPVPEPTLTFHTCSHSDSVDRNMSAEYLSHVIPRCARVYQKQAQTVTEHFPFVFGRCPIRIPAEIPEWGVLFFISVTPGKCLESISILDGRGVGVRVSVGARCSLFHVVQTGSAVHPASYPMGTGEFSAGV
jgi:hypothetical protein